MPHSLLRNAATARVGSGQFTQQKVRTFLASNRIVYDWQVREEDRPSSVEDFTVAIDLIECS